MCDRGRNRYKKTDEKYEYLLNVRVARLYDQNDLQALESAALICEYGFGTRASASLT